MDVCAKQLWEVYPNPEIQEIAKKEEFYVTPVAALVSSEKMKVFYAPFIDMRVNPQNYQPVPLERIDFVKESISSHARLAAEEDEGLLKDSLSLIERAWSAYRAKMCENIAFAHWVIQSGTEKSMFLYRFYVEVDGFLGYDDEAKAAIKPVKTAQMEVPFREYLDASGYVQEIPPHDPAAFLGLNNAIFRIVWGRAPFFCYYMMQAGAAANVVDLCCGAFNTERRFGYLEAGLNQHVVGFDLDSNIPEFIRQNYWTSIEEWGFKLYCENYLNAANHPELIGQQKYVQMAGGASYHTQELNETLQLAWDLLEEPKENGLALRFVFERDLYSDDMKHSAMVCGLQNQSENLIPDMSVDDSIAKVKAAIKEVGGFEIEEIIHDGGLYGCREDLDATFVLYVLKKVAKPIEAKNA